MRLMKLAHVNMVSVNIFSWALLESKPDHYYFDQLDRIMNMLAEHAIAADLATGTASPPHVDEPSLSLHVTRHTRGHPHESGFPATLLPQ
jgi:beta-galactosidase GanA